MSTSLNKTNNKIRETMNKTYKSFLSDPKQFFCKISGACTAILFTASFALLSFYVAKFIIKPNFETAFEKILPLMLFAFIAIVATGIFFKYDSNPTKINLNNIDQLKGSNNINV
jgi:hypothetical protein